MHRVGRLPLLPEMGPLETVHAEELRRFLFEEHLAWWQLFLLLLLDGVFFNMR